MKVVLRWFLALFLFQLFIGESVAKPSVNKDKTPVFFQQFGASSVHFHHSANEVQWHPKSKRTPEVLITFNPIRQQTASVSFGVEKGQKRSFSSRQLYVDNIKYTHEHTQVNNVAMGEIIGNGEHWYYQSTPEGTWSVDLNLHTYASLPRAKDTIGKAMLAKKYAERFRQGVLAQNDISQERAALDSANAQTTIVDVMLLYTQNIADVFPGDLLLALMEHLIAKSNQSFVNSDIDVQLRLVRVEFVDYPKPSSITAINDLTTSLIPENTNIEPSLANVSQWRDESGADIVAMIRTHNLNEREVCGIARFPNSQSDVLVNISNVGISGGSNCGLTFTHEIGLPIHI